MKVEMLCIKKGIMCQVNKINIKKMVNECIVFTLVFVWMIAIEGVFVELTTATPQICRTTNHILQNSDCSLGSCTLIIMNMAIG